MDRAPRARAPPPHHRGAATAVGPAARRARARTRTPPPPLLLLLFGCGCPTCAAPACPPVEVVHRPRHRASRVSQCSGAPPLVALATRNGARRDDMPAQFATRLDAERGDIELRLFVGATASCSFVHGASRGEKRCGGCGECGGVRAFVLARPLKEALILSGFPPAFSYRMLDCDFDLFFTWLSSQKNTRLLFWNKSFYGNFHW